MEEKKIGFFKRVKMAIFNLEKYEIFANERISKAIKYLLLLIVIVTIFLAIATTINISNEAGRFIDFFKSDEFPDFELADGKLEAKSKLNAYDEEFNSRLIIDTTEDLSDEKLEEYQKLARSSEYSIILLKDKIIYRFDKSQEKGLESTYNNNFTSSLGLKELSKKEVVENYLNDDILVKVKVIMFFYSYLTILLLNILTLLEDLIIVGIFGWLASMISKVKLSLTSAFSLAIYSLTLSIIFSTIYSVVRTFTGFEIKYFEIMYMIIAYIYIVAAIMIMKDENRTAGEAVTVEGEVLKTNEEDTEENEDKDKDKKDKEDKKEKLPEKKEKEDEEIPNENETKNDKGEN